MILSLLLYEHGNRVENHSLPPDHVFDVLTWQARDFPVPVQKDGCNCGVFVILNMYRMMKNVKDNSPMEVNFTKQYTPAELLKLRKLIVDICYMRATIEDFEEFNP
jgi:Ulp1 family protease